MPQAQISGQTRLRGIASLHLVHVQKLIMCAGNIFHNFLPEIFIIWRLQHYRDCSFQGYLNQPPSSAVYNNPASLLTCEYQPCFLVYLNVVALLHCSAVFINPTSYSTIYSKHSELPGCCSFSITANLDCLMPGFLCIHVCQFHLHSYTTYDTSGQSV